MSSDALRKSLEEFPRERLGHLPTPLEPARALSRFLGGPEIWIKRDDCTGLATGGNKTRKLEFLMGAARAEGVQGVMTFGALQSNHARQTAAAAARLGLSCDLILIARMGERESAWFSSGNRLLDEILGARVHPVDDGRQAAEKASQLLEEARSQERSLYVIPVGGSNTVGELGYVGCAVELSEQIVTASLSVSSLFHATSSLGTQSGLLVGLSALGSKIELVGMGVDDQLTAPEQCEEIARHAQSIAETLAVPPPETASIRVDDRQLGPGYGETTEAAQEAIQLAARHEGLLLDPVYTGKAMAGLIEAIRQREIPSDQTVIFLHTGGAPGLFAYPEAVRAGLSKS